MMRFLRTLFVIVLFATIITHNIYSQKKNIPEQQSVYERYVLSTLYALVSGEFKALQFQAYNLGKMRIVDYMSHHKLKGNEAVVLDISATVLESFPLIAKMIIEPKVIPSGFNDLKPVPGAIDFLNFVDSLGIKIFYISNRSNKQFNVVQKNLAKYHFPQISEDNILLKTDTSDKEQRRKTVMKNYKVILLFGDNLADFSDIFSVKTNQERNNIVLENKELFGREFIVLPNPLYGTWEDLIYKNNLNLTPAAEDSLRKETLKKFINF